MDTRLWLWYATKRASTHAWSFLVELNERAMRFDSLDAHILLLHQHCLRLFIDCSLLTQGMMPSL